MDDAFSKKRTYKKEGYKKLKSREGVNMTHTRALVSRGCHVANKSRQGDSFESCLLLQRLSQHDPPDKDLGATWVPRGRHLGATWRVSQGKATCVLPFRPEVNARLHLMRLTDSSLLWDATWMGHCRRI